jgi:type I restriction enzyme M protein
MRKYRESGDIELFEISNTPKQAFINIRNYLAGQHIGATRDDALLDETLKCLFCKLFIEKEAVQIDFKNIDPFELAKQIRLFFSHVRKLYFEIFQDDTEILLDPESIKYVMNQLNFSLLNSDSDPVGDAFEIFIGSQSKGNSGQFFTPKSVTKFIVEVLAPKPNETILDPACGAGGFLTTVCSYLSNNYKTDISEFISNNLFGIDKDKYLAKLAKTHIVLSTGDNANIIAGDSLSFQNGNGSIRHQLPNGGFDIIITNPPFGAKIIAANEDVLKTFDLAKRWVHNKSTNTYQITNTVMSGVPPQVLFIERCISLLNDNGRLGIVLPESVLSNKSYAYVVDYLTTNLCVDAIIGMPEALFKTSGKGGTHTKTCLVIARKKKLVEKYPIYMAEAKWCGQDSRARQIPNNDIPIILKETISYINHKVKPTFGFLINSNDINNHILCPRYYSNENSDLEVDISQFYQLRKIGELIDTGILTYQTGDEVGKLAYGTGEIPFIRTSDISNWELKSDPKHGLSEELYNSIKLKQDVRENDILMVKDGTYLIGTCAIITKNDLKIVYQSHLYKIRVLNESDNFTPFLLLALLNSNYVQNQIKSKQFTQDIIDSLGERIKEIKIPIPIDIEKRKKLSDKIRESISLKIKAKEVTTKVMKEIGL